MNKKERLEKIKKEVLKPNGDIILQIALLSNLSFKLNEEKDTAKKEILRNMTVSIKHCNLWCTIYIIIQAASLQRDIFHFLFLMQFSLERRTKTQPKTAAPCSPEKTSTSQAATRSDCSDTPRRTR